jgi:hypothetical protein
MLKDSTNRALIAFGLALNANSDGGIFVFFMAYRVVCKVIKQVYRDKGIYVKHGSQQHRIYEDNQVDIGLLISLF